jgi:hypothetical protein
MKPVSGAGSGLAYQGVLLFSEVSLRHRVF